MKNIIEIERKFIIKMPDLERIKNEENYTSSAIIQIYLASDNNVTRRIRKRVFSGSVHYTETTKIRVDKMSAIEREREISASDFELLSKSMRIGTFPISKVRHTFDYLGLTFEIDVYPEWKSTAVLEVELKERDIAITFPRSVEIIREVTGDKAYSNASMAMNFPKELQT